MNMLYIPLMGLISRLQSGKHICNYVNFTFYVFHYKIYIISCCDEPNVLHAQAKEVVPSFMTANDLYDNYIITIK